MEWTTTRRPPSAARLAWFAASVALATAATYALTTHHVWEDYLITFRHSQHLAEGHGLVFQPGERVHGFTSPLGVLLPAALEALLLDFDRTFSCFQLLGGAAFALGIVCFAQAMQWAGAARWSFAAAVPLAFEVKGVSFSVNGQETGLMILFLGLSVYLLSLPGLVRWPLLALAWAGLQWTRPDGFVIGGAWALSRLLFADRDERRPLIAAYLKAAGLALLLYLPWLVFTTLYYGSPVPHTVVAKSAVAELPTTLMGWWQRFVDRVGWILQPTCFFMGGWPPWVGRFGRAIGFAGLAVWLLPGGGELLRFARRASFAYLLLVGYFCAIPLSAWYVPPAALLLLAALAAAAVARPVPTLLLLLAGYVAAVQVEESRWRIGHSLQNTLLIAGSILLLAAWKLPRWAPSAAAFAGLAVYLGSVFGMSVEQIRFQQEIIETGCRKQVGLWLRDHVADDQTVFAECLGYLGYYSGRRMLDFPGLATPRVAAAHRSREWPKDLAPLDRMMLLIPELKPDWVVLRPHELAIAVRLAALGDDYRERVRFDVGPVIAERCPNVPGVGYLKLDSCFIVLERRDRGDAGDPGRPVERPGRRDS